MPTCAKKLFSPVDQRLEEEIRSREKKIAQLEAELAHERKTRDEALSESRKMRGKLDEAKSRVAESLDVVEGATRERDSALAEKRRLETEFADTVEKERARVREIYERNEKSLGSEVEALKSELRQQVEKKFSNLSF